MPTRYKGSARETTALNAYINLMRASAAITVELEEQLLEHGLTTSQFGILEALYHLGSMCQKELAEKLLKSGGNITMVIDNLEKKEFVERVRSEEDRRYYSIHLTTKGKKFIREIVPSHIHAIVERFSILTQQEQKNLREICRKLGKNEN